MGRAGLGALEFRYLHFRPRIVSLVLENQTSGRIVSRNKITLRSRTAVLDSFSLKYSSRYFLSRRCQLCADAGVTAVVFTKFLRPHEATTPTRIEKI